MLEKVRNKPRRLSRSIDELTGGQIQLAEKPESPPIKNIVPTFSVKKGGFSPGKFIHHNRSKTQANNSLYQNISIPTVQIRPFSRNSDGLNTPAQDRPGSTGFQDSTQSGKKSDGKQARDDKPIASPKQDPQPSQFRPFSKHGAKRAVQTKLTHQDSTPRIVAKKYELKKRSEMHTFHRREQKKIECVSQEVQIQLPKDQSAVSQEKKPDFSPILQKQIHFGMSNYQRKPIPPPPKKKVNISYEQFSNGHLVLQMPNPEQTNDFLDSVHQYSQHENELEQKTKTPPAYRYQTDSTPGSSPLKIAPRYLPNLTDEEEKQKAEGDTEVKKYHTFDETKGVILLSRTLNSDLADTEEELKLMELKRVENTVDSMIQRQKVNLKEFEKSLRNSHQLRAGLMEDAEVQIEDDLLDFKERSLLVDLGMKFKNSKVPYESLLTAQQKNGPFLENKASVFNTKWLGPTLRSSGIDQKKGTLHSSKRHFLKRNERRGSLPEELGNIFQIGGDLNDVVNREKKLILQKRVQTAGWFGQSRMGKGGQSPVGVIKVPLSRLLSPSFLQRQKHRLKNLQL